MWIDFVHSFLVVVKRDSQIEETIRRRTLPGRDEGMKGSLL